MIARKDQAKASKSASTGPLAFTLPSDPFDFSVDKWQAQLVAGYSKTLPNRGLKAFMPDHGDLGAGKRRVAR